MKYNFGNIENAISVLLFPKETNKTLDDNQKEALSFATKIMIDKMNENNAT